MKILCMLLPPKDEISSLCLLVISLQTKGNSSVISYGLSLNILLQMFSTIFYLLSSDYLLIPHG